MSTAEVIDGTFIARCNCIASRNEGPAPAHGMLGGMQVFAHVLCNPANGKAVAARNLIQARKHRQFCIEHGRSLKSCAHWLNKAASARREAARRMEAQVAT